MIRRFISFQFQKAKKIGQVEAQRNWLAYDHPDEEVEEREEKLRQLKAMRLECDGVLWVLVMVLTAIILPVLAIYQEYHCMKETLSIIRSIKNRNK